MLTNEFNLLNQREEVNPDLGVINDAQITGYNYFNNGFPKLFDLPDANSTESELHLYMI